MSEHPRVVSPDMDYLVTGPDCERARSGAIMSILGVETRLNLKTPENRKITNPQEQVSLFFS